MHHAPCSAPCTIVPLSVRTPCPLRQLLNELCLGTDSDSHELLYSCELRQGSVPWTTAACTSWFLGFEFRQVPNRVKFQSHVNASKLRQVNQSQRVQTSSKGRNVPRSLRAGECRNALTAVQPGQFVRALPCHSAGLLKKYRLLKLGVPAWQAPKASETARKTSLESLNSAN